MSSLQIRDLPEELYLALLEEAKRQNRSLAQQAIVLLAKGLQVEMSHISKRQRLVEEALSKPIVKEFSQLADPVQLIREDRER